MRFSRVLAITTGLLPALSSLASAAYLPPATRSVNPLLDPRDLSVEAHVCVDLDTNISVFLLGIVEIDIDLRVCLCVDAVVEYVNGRSDIPDDCKADASQKIANKIKNHPSAVQCHYPANCKPTSLTCSSSKKCACECEVGYTKNPTTDECECGAGTYDCHGECMSNSSPCPSAVPRRARSTTGQTAKRDDENVNKIAHGRRPLCPQGQTVCGVEMRGGTSMRGWECINIQTDLESCGGCAIPFSWSSIPGTDCSQIPHVADVGCEAGSCRIRRCAKGYAVSRDESTCVPVSLRSSTEATNSSRRGDRRSLHHSGSK